MRTLLLIILLFASITTFAGGTGKEDKTPEYVEGKVYIIDGDTFRFIGYDEKNNPQFEGFTLELPDYHGPAKRLIRHNKKAISW